MALFWSLCAITSILVESVNWIFLVSLKQNSSSIFPHAYHHQRWPISHPQPSCFVFHTLPTQSRLLHAPGLALQNFYPPPLTSPPKSHPSLSMDFFFLSASNRPKKVVTNLEAPFARISFVWFPAYQITATNKPFHLPKIHESMRRNCWDGTCMVVTIAWGQSQEWRRAGVLGGGRVL